MKLQIHKDTIREAVAAVKPAIPNKSANPALENILMTTKEDGTITFTASDGEITLVKKIQDETNQITQSAQFLIPSKVFYDIIDSLPDGMMRLETIEDKNTMKITWIGGASVIPLFDTNDYPVAKTTYSEDDTISFNGEELATAISKTVKFVSDNELHPALCGVHLDIRKDKACIVASDCQSLVVNDVKCLGKEIKCIISEKSASMLKSFKTDEEIKATITANDAIFRNDTLEMTCRLINQKYPAYEKVIPQGGHTMSFERKTLLQTIRRVKVCADKGMTSIQMQIKNDRLTVTAEDNALSMSAKETINNEYSGDEMTISVKADMMMEILNVISSENITMTVSAPNKAVVITPENKSEEPMTAVLMPLKTK